MDLRRALAYSTVSSLGPTMSLYAMDAAPGGRVVPPRDPRLLKAVFFLCSGSVINAMEEVVGHEPCSRARNMRLMGRSCCKHMPVTATNLPEIGCVAISGIPPLAGFSGGKDEILGQAFHAFPSLAVGFPQPPA